MNKGRRSEDKYRERKQREEGTDERKTKINREKKISGGSAWNIKKTGRKEEKKRT